jgi:NTP pyrophosphatase (non-canonical NTP hydrolase)
MSEKSDWERHLDDQNLYEEGKYYSAVCPEKRVDGLIAYPIPPQAMVNQLYEIALTDPAPVSIPVVALAMKLREHFPGFSLETLQVTGLAEEAGEFVGAWRRWKGMARRTGTKEEMEEELADVVITAYTAAYVLDSDLNDAIQKKLEKVFTRGWKDPR